VDIGNDNIRLLAQNVGKTASNVYNFNRSGKDNHTKLYHAQMHNKVAAVTDISDKLLPSVKTSASTIGWSSMAG